MMCPKCRNNTARYLQRRVEFIKTKEKKFERSNFAAKCSGSGCGWEGAII